MSTLSMRRIRLLLTLFGAAACSGTEPAAKLPTQSVTMTFCKGTFDTPGVDWFAYKNEDGPWTRATAIGDSVTFNGTAKLIVALVDTLDFGGSSRMDVIHLTAAQARRIRCPATLAAGKTLQGSIATTSESGRLTLGPVIRGFSGGTYTLTSVPSGALDLIATSTHDVGGAASGTTVDRAIIRRGQDFADGATIPVLNFAAAESFAPSQITLSATGNFGSLWFGRMSFITGTGNRHDLRFGFLPSATDTLPAIPAANTIPGDLHRLQGETTSLQYMVQFFRVPSDRTFAFGPPMSVPTLTTVAVSPQLLLRATIASQAAYPDAATMEFFQVRNAGDYHTIVITVWREFHGATPTAWTLEIPDLSGAAGYQAKWGMLPGSYDWTAHTSRGAFDLRYYDAMIVNPPSDGDYYEVVRSEGSTGSVLANLPGTSLAQRSGTGAGVPCGLRSTVKCNRSGR